VLIRGKMIERNEDYIVIRESTRAERRANAIWLLIGGTYSVVFWTASVLDLWRLTFG
jgi:hypothetical protein